MNIDNEYHSFLRRLEQHQSTFDDDGYQYFLCGMSSSEGQDIFNSDISDICKKYSKEVIVINNSELCNAFVNDFWQSPRKLNNELIVINLFNLDENQTAEIIKKMNTGERDLKNNSLRVIFSFSIEQYQKYISRTEFFQFRTTTYFDENDLIKKYDLFKKLDSSLPETTQAIKKNKI